MELGLCRLAFSGVKWCTGEKSDAMYYIACELPSCSRECKTQQIQFHLFDVLPEVLHSIV
jgi:hypothetical protein